MEKIDVKLLLKELNIAPKKKWGQNFIVDKNLLNKIIELSELNKSEIVLEVGSGLGALTNILQKKVKKVIGFEIDPILSSFLQEKFSDNKKVSIFNKDILEISLPEHNKIVSNIPYSITGPLLEKLFFKVNPPQGIITIENSLAERIFYDGSYSNFSRITATVNSFMHPVEKINVSRFSFYPPPRIGLSLIKLKPKHAIHDFLTKEIQIDFYLDFIAGIMPYKNKNISNAIKLFLKREKIDEVSKNQVKKILEESDYSDTKLFKFEIEKLINLSEIFYNLINEQ